MLSKYFDAQVGDTVCINPYYWRRERHQFMEPYRSNPVDHVYVITEVHITEVDGRLSLMLDDIDSGWTNDFRYLIPFDSPNDLNPLPSIFEVLYE